MIHQLYLGDKFSGYSVVPDAKYPGVMWRVQSPDGSLSDMVNLTRAKDAAIAYARPRGLGGHERHYWQALE